MHGEPALRAEPRIQMLTPDQLEAAFRGLDMRPGDTWMVHSSFKSLGPVQAGPSSVVDALLRVLGPDGTLLLPTFNFNSWTEGHYFDIVETPSEMGVIGELARRRSDFARTWHPIYSFAAAGARQRDFLNCRDREAYGDDSVFARFLALDGLIVSLGLDFNSTFSLHHYVEKKVGITYRRVKEFGGIYVDGQRAAEVTTFSMFVRAEPWFETYINPGMDELLAAGILDETRIGDAEVHTCRAQKFFDNMAPIARDHPEKLHRISPGRS